MTEDQKTVFELAPERFTVPGQSRNGTAPTPDLEFLRDDAVPGVYRAKIDRVFLPTGRNNNNGDQIVFQKR